MSRSSLSRGLAGASLLAVIAAGCAQLLDYGDYNAPGAASGGKIDGGVCAPGDTRPCYDGPEGTEDAGRCRGGVQACDAKGMWGACVAEVTPGDAGCTCAPGAERPCYDGPPGTEGIGICKAGSQTCEDSGIWGACSGSVPPAIEQCSAGTNDPVNQVDEDCDGLSGCVGAYRWAHRYGNAAGGQLGYAVAVDKLDNIIVVGHVGGTFELGGVMTAPSDPTSTGADPDIGILKLDASGKLLWFKRFGDAASQAATSVAVDADGNIVVVADVAGTVDVGGGALGPFMPMGADKDVLVFKLDPDGGYLWAHRYGDAGDQVTGGVAIDSMGNIAFAGSFTGAIELTGDPMAQPIASLGAHDVFVAKLDPGGKHVWSKAFGGEVPPDAGVPQDANQDANGVAFAPDGSVVVVGSFAGNMAFDQTPTLTAVGSTDAFLAKLDVSTGTPLWSSRLGGNAPTSTAVASAVAVDAKSGNVVVTGTFSGDIVLGPAPKDQFTATGADIFLLSLDATGKSVVFSKGISALLAQTATAIAIDGSSDVVLGGNVVGNVDFGGGPLIGVASNATDAAVAKYDATGNHLFSKRFGDAASQSIGGVATDSRGNVILTGGTLGVVDFGGGPLGTVDMNNDIIVAKLSP